MLAGHPPIRASVGVDFVLVAVEPEALTAATPDIAAYRRLADSEGFIAALTSPSLARPVAARADLRFVPAGLALLLVLARHGLGRASWRARARQWRQRLALHARRA